jgi:DNA-binding NarL/FixJ family response regulator
MGFRDAGQVSEAQVMGLRVFIVDQERTFADALAGRLEAERDIAMVAAVSVALPELPPVVSQEADIMLLDADLPGGAAFTLCREVARRGIAAHVIMLSYSAEAERVAAAVRAGAGAWLSKSESLEHLLRVMRGIVQGETWLPPAVMGHVLTLLLRGDMPPRRSDLLLATLTPREREVLGCLAEGAARRDVAARLSLSANTVRTHTQNLMAKLQVHSALEAVALTRSELRQAAAPPHDQRWARAGGVQHW